MTKRIFLYLGLVAVAGYLSALIYYLEGRFIYGEILEGTKLQYEVYDAKVGLPILMFRSDDGGPGIVKVFNDKNQVVIKVRIKSALSEVFVSENNLVIASEGVWPISKYVIPEQQLAMTQRRVKEYQQLNAAEKTTEMPTQQAVDEPTRQAHEAMEALNNKFKAYGEKPEASH